MRNLFLLVFGFIAFVSCSDKSNEMRVSGEIEGLKKGTLFLEKIEDTSFVSVDSMTIDGKSNFEFSQEIDEPEVFYLTMQFNDSIKTQKRIPFFGEPSQIRIQSELKNFEISSTVTGSKNHEKWDEYKGLMNRYNNKGLDLIEAYYNAVKEGKDSIAQQLKLQQDKLVSARYLATINFAKNHPDMAISPYLMLTEAFDANIRYHDTIYKLLSPKIKNSRYGKELESFIDAYKVGN